GASSSHRWMNCPGSNNLIAKLGESRCRSVGEAARPGTAAHALAARYLTETREPWEFYGNKFDDYVVDKDMVEAVMVYTDYCYGLGKQSATSFTEIGLESLLDSEAFGTADHLLYAPSEFIHIVDYKHGAG